ncbi:uncharacterized protein LOC118192814 [Stegodyphus dumicola]|uniref:uncharacterized protein LOC118192814 n=1 Tax=Stegodyphus dumicola TaxID=202533 RepID=UPI0015ABACB4|nr:uncharacterized protein LOC118192814 [Stegodyphus dumicola]
MKCMSKPFSSPIKISAFCFSIGFILVIFHFGTQKSEFLSTSLKIFDVEENCTNPATEEGLNLGHNLSRTQPELSQQKQYDIQVGHNPLNLFVPQMERNNVSIINHRYFQPSSENHLSRKKRRSPKKQIYDMLKRNIEVSRKMKEPNVKQSSIESRKETLSNLISLLENFMKNNLMSSTQRYFIIEEDRNEKFHIFDQNAQQKKDGENILATFGSSNVPENLTTSAFIYPEYTNLNIPQPVILTLSSNDSFRDTKLAEKELLSTGKLSFPNDVAVPLWLSIILDVLDTWIPCSGNEMAQNDNDEELDIETYVPYDEYSFDENFLANPSMSPIATDARAIKWMLLGWFFLDILFLMYIVIAFSKVKETYGYSYIGGSIAKTGAFRYLMSSLSVVCTRKMEPLVLRLESPTSSCSSLVSLTSILEDTFREETVYDREWMTDEFLAGERKKKNLIRP